MSFHEAGLAKRLLLLLIAVLFAVAPVSGCHRKQKQQEDQAKAAVDHAIKEGLGKYAPDEAKTLNQKLKMATEEEHATDEPAIRRAGARDQSLEQIRREAETLEAALPAKKKEAQEKAEKTLSNAKKAFATAKTAADPYLTGRLKHGNPTAITQALALVSQTITQAEQLLSEEDYVASAKKAAQAAEESRTLAEQFTHSGPGRNR